MSYNQVASLRKRRIPLAIFGTASVMALVAGGAAMSASAGNSQAQDVTTAAEAVEQHFDLERSYAPLVEAVMPAVVNVSVEKNDESVLAGNDNHQFVPPGLEPFFERFFGQPMPEMPEGQGPSSQMPQRGEGSGFIIDAAGHIVTNAHVAGGADRITVLMSDGTESEAKLIGIDEKTDLALLKVESDTSLPYVEFGDSDQVRVGDKVLAVGNPFGLGGTVTAGIISATNREIGNGPYDDFLQVDAPINRGNSGGPTFDLDGHVVGINTLIFSPSGGNIGIGFAISSNLAKQVIADLADDGLVERGWLGVGIQAIDEDLAHSLGLASTDGALVTQVRKDTPAEAAGFEEGDVIVAFGGTPISELRDLTRIVADTDPGTRIDAEILRGGERQTIAVDVGRMPESLEVASATAPEVEQHGRLGLALAPLDPQARSQAGLADDAGGVLVASVAPNSPASGKGFRPGDVILRVGTQQVSEPGEVASAVAAAEDDGETSLLMLVARDGSQRFTTVPLTVS